MEAIDDNHSSNYSDTNLQYIIVVSVLTFIFPAIGLIVESSIKHIPFTFNCFGKWFIFFAVGVRLFLAGIRQATNPAFTAKEIFHISGTESYPILRELGFANACFGLVALISLFKPEWRMVSAFASGLYYGIAGVQHLVKKPVGTNEKFAMVTDIIIFLFLLIYFLKEL